MEQLLAFPSIQEHVGTGASEITFVRQFDYNGCQGKVGLVKTKDHLLVYKTGLYLDFGIRHEAYILERIRGVRSWCPHFAEGIGLVTTNLVFSEKRRDPPFPNQKNPEAVPFTGECLLMEYIPGSKTLTEQVDFMSTAKLFSAIRQTLLAIEIGYRNFGLVHYDLHTDNVLLTSCPKKAIFLYNLGDRQICVPTHGVIPVIIDYGFAYVKGSTQPLYQNLNHTDGGCLGCVADPRYDARIFLVNMADSMKMKDPVKYGKFYQEIRQIYQGLHYHPTKGWSDYGEYSASEMVEYTLAELEVKEKICSEIANDTYLYTSLFQSLVSLPLVNTKNGDFRPHYRIVASELNKLSATTRTRFTRTFLFRTMIDQARSLREMWKENPAEAVQLYRNNCFAAVETNFKFYVFPEINYELLLENLFRMGDCIGTVYYRVLQRAVSSQKQKYGEMKNLKTNLEIHDLIERKYTTEYSLEPDTPVYLWDTDKKTSLVLSQFTEEECREFNALSLPERAGWLWTKIRDS